MRRTSEDTLSLSFTDVLTCVLGAAIALFLIFVALITLSGSQGAVKGESNGYSSAKLKSIQEKINQGFATSTVKIVSDNPALIEYIISSTAANSRLGNASRLEILTVDGMLSGVQFDFFENLPAFRIDASDEVIGRSNETLAIWFVTVGGMSKCIKHTITPDLFAESSSAPLFRLGPREKMFINSRYEHTLC